MPKFRRGHFSSDAAPKIDQPAIGKHGHRLYVVGEKPGARWEPAKFLEV